jgi:hypothetical protein
MGKKNLLLNSIPVSQEIALVLRKVKACSSVDNRSLLVREENVSILTIANKIKEDGVDDISNIRSSFMAHQRALHAKQLYKSTHRCIMKQLKTRNLNACTA